MDKLVVRGTEINVQRDLKQDDFLSLTDIAKIKDSDNPRYIIQNWLRNRNTIEFLGVWETLYNPNFNRVEFDAFRSQAGLNSFVMTPQKWVDATGAIGIVSKAGRYGGTYAHKEIAFEFASWISVEFKLYLVKEFERLKTEEMKQLGWDIKRNLAKINYRIHTDAIKENLIPPELSARQISLVYANEADVLNMVPVQSGKSECGVRQRRNPADGAPGETQRHCHQSDEGADGGSQNAAVQRGERNRIIKIKNPVQ